MERNQVTEHMLALASSVSPKYVRFRHLTVYISLSNTLLRRIYVSFVRLWKDACQVYVEQLIQADQLMPAVNFLLALNEDEEAIDLLCDKRRFKEAFAIARLRFDDTTVCHKVLEKWIGYCFNCGLYRLAAHW